MLFLFKVNENTEKAQRNMKLDYDAKKKKGVKTFNFFVGDEIKRRNNRKEGQKGNRLQKKWLAPYVIADMMGSGACVIENVETKKKASRINFKDLCPQWVRSKLPQFPLPHSLSPPPLTDSLPSL